jgi:phage gpG-like protein
LNEKYALRKAAAIGHTRILVWSETLMESVTTESGTQFSVRDVGKRRMTFGTTVPYAAVHQHGSTDGTTPARPFLVMQTEDYEAMLDRTIDYILSVGDYSKSGAST